LIVTLSSGIIPALQQFAQNLTGIPNTLATELPKASTFFLTFVLLQLAGTAGAFLQIVTLIIYYVKLVILGSTPRSIWNLKYGPRNIGAWGTLWPNTTLIVVIGRCRGLLFCI
jgi:calcium permeable stress-gated cation channel